MARTIVGTVTSDKADKTIVITVATRKTHPLYKKQYTVTSKFIAHDEDNKARMGDKVEITEGRPISKRKRFTMTKVIETARIQHVEPEVVVEKAAKTEVADAAEEPAAAKAAAKEEKA